MAEETVGCLCIHAAKSGICVDLCFADLAYFRILRQRVHEYESAYACLWDHGITFCKLDAEAELAGKDVDDVSL